MGLISMWREARGNVMRKEYDDVMARMRNANQPARRAFLSNIDATIDEMTPIYASASPSERKAILRECRKIASAMWDRGDWPWALGSAITCLNVESRFVPGEDAAYVRAETDRLIKEAQNAEPLPRR